MMNISNNPNMETLSFPKLELLNGLKIESNPGLKEVQLGNRLKEVEDFYFQDNDQVVAFRFESPRRVDSALFYENELLETVSFSSRVLHELGIKLERNPSLKTLDLGQLRSLKVEEEEAQAFIELIDNDLFRTLSLPTFQNLTQPEGATTLNFTFAGNQALKQINLPAFFLSDAEIHLTVKDNPSLELINFPNLITCPKLFLNVTNNPKLTLANFPLLLSRDAEVSQEGNNPDFVINFLDTIP